MWRLLNLDKTRLLYSPFFYFLFCSSNYPISLSPTRTNYRGRERVATAYIKGRQQHKTSFPFPFLPYIYIYILLTDLFQKLSNLAPLFLSPVLFFSGTSSILITTLLCLDDTNLYLYLDLILRLFAISQFYRQTLTFCE